MGWGARFAGVVVTGALLSAAGCGAGPEGQALPAAASDPTASPSLSPPAPSPSPSPESTPEPTRPEGAGQEDLAGAQAFALYWIAIANHALASGDVSTLRKISADSCKTCTARIDDIEKAYEDGGRIEGGALLATDSSGAPVEQGTTPSIAVDVDVSAEKIVNRAGHVADQFPKDRIRMIFFLDRTDSSWKVARITLGSKP